MTSNSICTALTLALLSHLAPTLYGQTVGQFQQNGLGSDMSDTIGYQITANYNNVFTGSTSDLSLVMIGWETPSGNPVALNGVTYGGSSMTHLFTQTFTSSNINQMMALYYLQNPADGISLIEADFSSVPGRSGQLLFSNVLNQVAGAPTIYDTASLNGSALTLSAPASSASSLYYDLVLHGTSWANYSWGAYPPVSGSGGQTMAYVPNYDGASSLAMLVGTEVTSAPFSHTYTYAVGNNFITGIGLKFDAVPEPSSLVLVGLAGALGVFHRRRTASAL